MGTFVQHVGCPKCDSRDNLGVYLKDDCDDYVPKYDATCFGCGFKMEHDELIDHGILDENGKLSDEVVKSARTVDPEWVMKRMEDISKKPFKGMPQRRIKRETLEMYNVRCEWDDETEDRVGYHFPSYHNEELCGWKYKPLHKNQDGKYEYRVVGSCKQTDEMFGQSSFPAGGKFLVITTGQEDAMAFHEALKESTGGKFETACVSVNNGDKSVRKQFQSNYKYISSFDKVILAFDNDDNAKEALDVACKMLKPGQAHIAKLSRYKDACEYKKRQLDKRLVSAFYEAERYSPIEIVSLGGLWNEFATQDTDDIIPLPPEFETLGDMMNGGPVKGEVTVVSALTSVGKSSIINRWAYHWAFECNLKTGLMYLESSGKELVSSFLSMHNKSNLAVQKVEGRDLVELKRQFDTMIGEDGNVMVVNHHGAFRNIEDMTDKLRWMAKSGECDVIIIDPLQAAVPSNSNELIDEFMDAMLKLAKETNVSIIVVSHMKKPDGKDPHDVDEYSLKGSSSINQIAFNTILLSRDKVHSNEIVKNSTKMTLVKCRRTGNTGDAGWLAFNSKTVELNEIENPYENLQVDNDFYMDDDTGPINSFGNDEVPTTTVEKAPWEWD